MLTVLDAMFQGNVKARVLLPEGTYKRKRPSRGEEPFRAQIHLHREAQRRRERSRAVAGVALEPLEAPKAD